MKRFYFCYFSDYVWKNLKKKSEITNDWKIHSNMASHLQNSIASRTRRSRADLLASPQFLSQVCNPNIKFQIFLFFILRIQWIINDIKMMITALTESICLYGTSNNWPSQWRRISARGHLMKNKWYKILFTLPKSNAF